MFDCFPRVTLIVGLILFFVPSLARGQTWTTEVVDLSGESISMAADVDGNIHMSYLGGNGMVKYGFRPAHTSRWFTMDIPGAASEGSTHLPTKIALDPQGNPHVCYTPGELKYASFDGKHWNIQQIDPASGQISFTCSVAVAPDGTQHILWYQYGMPGGGYYLHLKHAVLRDGVWMARTVDYEGQTGKWNSMVIDPRGVPNISYDSFLKNELKYAYWNSKEWKVSVVDSPERGGAGGKGNSLILNRDGKAQISYVRDDALLYAWPTATSWKIDTVSQISTNGGWLGYRTRQALDPQGNPHIVYEDGGSVKHAFWDGSHWSIQLISGPGPDPNRYEDIAIDHQGTIYIGYRDASDNSVKVAVGLPQAPTQNPLTQQKPDQ
jgi:hypothetical protein